MSRHTYLWEFLVKPGSEVEFIKHYGPEGTWVQLFRQAPGFMETLFLKDSESPRRYVTLDRWRSAAEYQTFRTRFTRQYQKLDEVCGGLTISETYLGTFSE